MYLWTARLGTNQNVYVMGSNQESCQAVDFGFYAVPN